MKAYTRTLVVALLLLAGTGTAQQLQIIRPDGRVFQSITASQYAVVELPDRFNRFTRYAGQITQIGPETITMKIRRQSQTIPIREITALRRISKFGAWARRSGRIIVPFTLATAGDIEGDMTKGGSDIKQLIVPAAVAVGAGAIAYLLLHTPPLKKAKNGYSFKTGN